MLKAMFLASMRVLKMMINIENYDINKIDSKGDVLNE